MKRPKLSFNSILSRLLISFLLIIAPILIAGVIMFTWEKQTIKSQIKDIAHANISFLTSSLETETQNIKMLQYDLRNDLKLQQLVVNYQFLPKYEYYILIKDVQQRLLVMKNSNALIQDVVLYVPKMNRMISAEKGYVEFDNEAYERTRKRISGLSYPIIIEDSEIFAAMLPPTYSQNSGAEPLYLVEIVFSKAKMRNYVDKFSKYNKSDIALYDCFTKKWILSNQVRLQIMENPRIEDIVNNKSNSLDTIEVIDGKKYYTFINYSKILNFAFVEYVPQADIFKVLDRYQYFLWLYVILSVLIVLVYSFSTYKFVKTPINKLLQSFRHLEEGDLSVRIKFKAANEFNYLFERFNKMVYRLHDLIDKLYKQEIYARKSELKQLQAQINPHFLYNSYFMLHRMIKDADMKSAQELSLFLGKYFQYITRNAHEEVTLHKEMEHAYSYAKIQEMRFSQRLGIQFGDIPENYRDLMVPRIILQPILENCFEHGLKETLKGGIVNILFNDMGNGLSIVVEDNGGNLSDSDIESLQRRLSQTDAEAEITGIPNVHKRLVLKFSSGSGITVTRSMLGGLKVELKIIVKDQIG